MSQTETMQPNQRREPIAIVGIGCRFPGGADSPKQLWRLLCEGFDAIGPIPANRFDAEALYDERPATPGKIMTRSGGFLDAIDTFDASFFGIAPREAERLDPQQRLLLETAWEAIADAGISTTQLAGSNTGVFVGMWLNEFESRLFADLDSIDFYMTTGSGRYTASGRISYTFDVFGPSITVDSACSSSLVAVHLACQSIWSGECGMALAGGANVILQPNITIAYSQSRMMAPDGHCKFGDAAADGYVRSDGAAIVALKPLSAARADGDPIYALIRGSAVTNDGRSSGFLATPGQFGQEEMLRRAYAHAGVDPQHVQYVEAHGTGTRAGDPIELGAIGAVLGAGRPVESPCLVGSIKTNVGHTEGAAGVAGLIKVALALKHGQIPPSLHQHTPNPNIPWRELGLEVCNTLRPWPMGDSPAIGGVSSFGIAGTNAHIVLQAAPVILADESVDERPQLLTLSAQTPAALHELARSYLPLLDANEPELADLCYSASARATHHSHRVAIAAADRAKAASAVQAFLENSPRSNVSSGQAAEAAPGVVFVFPGQGSQWVGMARELLRDEPVFRAAIERCEQAMASFVDWSLLEQLTADETQLDEIDVIQPALFAIQVALAALWRSWGIEPVAVVGHSMGEVAAAHVAGALSLADAARVICVRSKLLRRVRGRGAMAVVGLPLAAASAAINGYEDRIAIAVSNSPRSTVLSGDALALDEVLVALRARDIFCRLVRVDVASHSPQMDELLPDLAAALDGIVPLAASLSVFSTVNGGVLIGEEARATFGAAYWVDNLRQPVRFADTIERLCAAGSRIFIELSPHPILLSPIEETVQHCGQTGLALPSLQRNNAERLSMLGSLGALYTLGITPNWSALYRECRQVVRLPGYPWQRQRYWLSQAVRREQFKSDTKTLLGAKLPKLAILPESHLWAGELNPAAIAPASRRTIQGVDILAGAVFAWLALEAAAVVGDRTHVDLCDLVVRTNLVLNEMTCETQVVVTPAANGAAIQIYSRVSGNDRWVEHVCATIEPRRDIPPAINLKAINASKMAATVMVPGLCDVRLDAEEALARLESDDRDDSSALSAAFGLFEALGTPEERALLNRIDRLSRYGHTRPVFAYARRTAEVSEVSLLDEHGNAVVTAHGIQRSPPSPALNEQLMLAHAARWFYDVQWRPLPAMPSTKAPRLLILADRGGLGEQLAQRAAERGGQATLFERSQIDSDNPDALRRVLSTMPPSGDGGWDAVVDLRALDVTLADPQTGEELLAQQHAITWDALAVAQALVRESSGTRLWLVTRNAAATGQATVAAEQATLWGIGRVIANEHPECWGGLIDLDDTAHAGQLLDALLANDDEDQVAIRATIRLAARLAPVHISQELPAQLRTDGSYLVTGGLGGVGMALVRWMLEHGARNIALLGRRALDEAGATVLRQLEQDGATVSYFQADVACAESLALALAELATVMPPLRGIIHAAGVLDDAALLSQSWASVEHVMAPKLAGTWNLHRQTADLDLFVLCSSASALLGTPGQANYAAANAFLDAFAHMRRAAGLAASSINWGRWDEIGLAAQAGRDVLLERRGLTAMTPAVAAAAFGALLNHPLPQVAVAAVDWTAQMRQLPRTENTPLLREIIESVARIEPQIAAAEPDLLATLINAPASERDAICRAFVQETVAVVLRFETPEQVTPDRGFFQLGMDSLTAVEVRNRLGRSLGQTLSATLAFDYPTVNRLTRHLLDDLFPSPEVAETSEAVTDFGAETLEDLSRDDIKALLDAELDAIDL